jgi:aspartate ammonia-lyase
LTRKHPTVRDSSKRLPAELTPTIPDIVCRGYVEKSIGLVPAMVPVIGYEQSAAIAKEALKTGGSVYELLLERKLVSKEELDEILRPENMTDPWKIPIK